MSRTCTARREAYRVFVCVVGFGWIVAGLLPGAALAQGEPGGFATNISGGWSELRTDNGDSLLDGTDGWFLDTDFAWRLGPHSPLWLGFGFAGSYYSASGDFTSGAAGLTETDVAADLSLFALEPRLRYIIQTGDGGPGLYVAPRIGAGLLITDFEAAAVTEFPGGAVSIDGESETNFSFEIRPALEIGFSGGPWVVGAEASYMWAWVSEDAIGDTLEEARLGIFFRFGF